MREATPGRSGDPDAARVDPRPYSRMHTQQKGGLGTGRAPSSPHAYLQSRAQSYPLHHLLSRMGVARPQQWIQPHHSIIDLSFDQARGKAGVPQDKAADSVSEFRPITRFCTEEGNGLGVITINFLFFYLHTGERKTTLLARLKNHLVHLQASIDTNHRALICCYYYMLFVYSRLLNMVLHAIHVKTDVGQVGCVHMQAIGEVCAHAGHR